MDICRCEMEIEQKKKLIERMNKEIEEIELEVIENDDLKKEEGNIDIHRIRTCEVKHQKISSHPP
jgi:hypothetical protein